MYIVQKYLLNIDYLLRSLIRERSLMLHTAMTRDLVFFRSHTKDHIRLIALHDREGICPDLTKNITGRVHSHLISCVQVVLWGLSKDDFLATLSEERTESGIPWNGTATRSTVT